MSATPDTQEVKHEAAATRLSSHGLPVMQVMYFFLFAFAAAVALFFVNAPPIFPAILIGVAIGFVIFYALGGIESSTKFSLGPVNVSGSLAAIAATTFGINLLLSNQIIDPKNAFPEAQWLAVTSDLAPVDSVQIGRWGFWPSPKLAINTSTPLDLKKSGSDYQVNSIHRPGVVVGLVNRDTIGNLVGVEFPNQKLDTHKTIRLHENSKDRGYNRPNEGFPFYLETGSFRDASFYSLKDKRTDDVLFRGSLKAGQYQIAEIEDKTYFITTALIDHQLDKILPYDTSFVQFIIGELQPQKTY